MLVGHSQILLVPVVARRNTKDGVLLESVSSHPGGGKANFWIQCTYSDSCLYSQLFLVYLAVSLHHSFEFFVTVHVASCITKVLNIP